MVHRVFLSFLLLGLATQQSRAQKISPSFMGEVHEDIDELSGLAMLPSGRLVQINDSGNPACVFFSDTTGSLTDIDCAAFLENKDWEALAYGKGYLFIGDFGNNNNNRTDQVIYRAGITEDYRMTDQGNIKFRFAEQQKTPASPTNRNFDVEAMIYDRDSIHIFTKNRTKPFSGYTYMYSMPAEPGSYVVSRKDSFKLGDSNKMQHWVTGASINTSGDIMVLLGYKRMWVFYDFPPGQYFSGYMSSLEFKSLSQKEAITFSADSILYIADERHPVFKGGRLYKLKLISEHFATRETEIELTSGNEFQNQIRVNLTGVSSLPILWEMYTVHGDRPLFGKISEPSENDSYTLDIDTSTLPPGGYVLSIIIDNQPRAYKLKKLLKNN